MALQIVEFFGLSPNDPGALQNIHDRTCPFIGKDCVKPKHGACSVRQIKGAPIVCCPNRLYASNYSILTDIAQELFGAQSTLIQAVDIAPRKAGLGVPFTGSEVVVFGRHWGQELPLPRPSSQGKNVSSNYYMDWILARLDKSGELEEFTAVEVQTIDTTGNYTDQANDYFAGEKYTDAQGRTPGFSKAGMNWENVNKRILPQLIYKGHVIRREVKCTKGLFFVCPFQVYERIIDRLGGEMHSYHPSSGTITFRSYELGEPVGAGQYRGLRFAGQFTTTVDQVALAFTSPRNLPAEPNVYEKAIEKALRI